MTGDRQEGPKFRLFGRRQAKPLKPRQERLMQELLPKLAITADKAGATQLLCAAGERPLWLEIGFGGGEHLAWQATRNPHVFLAGAEPFINGVGKLLGQIEDAGLENIRILHGDVRPLLEALPDGALDRLFILHPDPWPKKRHHKRRIVSPFLLRESARLLKPGSEMRIASDIPDYIRWTLLQVQRHNHQSDDFQWTAECQSDWLSRPDDWPQTRYEAKALAEGRPATYLRFLRK